MRRNNVLNLLILTLLCMTAVSVAVAKTLYMDDFNDNKKSGGYVEFGKGVWVEENGILKQTNAHPGDPTYLTYDGAFPEPHTAIVMIRIDSWVDHDLSRAGLGFRNDPKDGGRAYAFLIHERLTSSNMEFLNDARAWKGSEGTSPVEVGKWYWMKAEIADSGIRGKIWSVDDDEPDGWLMESALNFGGARGATGIVGLNGGSSSAAGSGDTTVSFDNWVICDNPDDCTPAAVQPEGKLATTWGDIKK